MGSRKKEAESLKKLVEDAIRTAQEWKDKRSVPSGKQERYDEMIRFKHKIQGMAGDFSVMEEISERLLQKLREKIPQMIESELNIESRTREINQKIKQIEREIYVIHNSPDQPEKYLQYLNNLNALLDRDIDFEKMLGELVKELQKLLKKLKKQD